MSNRMCQTCLNFACAHPADLNIWMLVGHHPNCPDLKIDKEQFVKYFDIVVDQKYSAKIAQEIVKVEKKFERKAAKRKNPGLTATLIQARMFHWLNRKGHGSIVPNLKCFFTGEMDLCSVMKSGKINEYEIKISRSDFKKDLSKENKHATFREHLTGKFTGDRAKFKQLYEHSFAPNFFHYVVPTDLVKPDEVPDYAGLIYINPNNTWDFTTVKKAVQLHDRIITDKIRVKIKTALMYRCWDSRSRIEEMLRGEFR